MTARLTIERADGVSVPCPPMAERLRAWARWSVLGGLWGMVLSVWFDTGLVRGALIGFALWGAALFVSLPGPYAPVVEAFA